MHVRRYLLLGLVCLAACAPQTESPADPLPTLAQLPTTQPTQPIPTQDLASESAVTAEAGVPPFPTDPGLPVAPTTAFVDVTPLPFFDDQPVIFPTLAFGEMVILEGQMSLQSDLVATLTDSEGTAVTVIVDPFAAQLGAGQLVRITGMVERQDGELVVRMSAIELLTEPTPPPLPGEVLPGATPP